MHVDGGVWKGGGHVADAARVVEMDVRDGHTGEPARLTPSSPSAASRAGTDV